MGEKAEQKLDKLPSYRYRLQNYLAKQVKYLFPGEEKFVRLVSTKIFTVEIKELDNVLNFCIWKDLINKQSNSMLEALKIMCTIELVKYKMVNVPKLKVSWKIPSNEQHLKSLLKSSISTSFDIIAYKLYRDISKGKLTDAVIADLEYIMNKGQNINDLNRYMLAQRGVVIASGRINILQKFIAGYDVMYEVMDYYFWSMYNNYINIDTPLLTSMLDEKLRTEYPVVRGVLAGQQVLH